MFRTALRTRITQNYTITSVSRSPSTSTCIRTASLSTSSSKSADLVVDQTRKDNKPGAERTDPHKEQTKSADVREADGELTNQQKGNPQPTPSRSTGIETERSDGGKAGEGTTENVHTETDAGPNMPGFEKQKK